MGCSRKLMSFRFCVMLRLLLLYFLAEASSMNFAVLADMLIAARDLKDVDDLKSMLKSKFEMKDLGAAKKILAAHFRLSASDSPQTEEDVSMEKTLEKYQRCSYGSLETTPPSNEAEQASYQEYLKLKAKVDVLQRSQRNLLGEDLGEMSTKELEQLEHQLDKSLRQIRSIKTQCMLDQLEDLQRKEEILLENNRTLKTKLEESCASLRPAWGAAAAAGGVQTEVAFGRQQPADCFFELLHCDTSTLQHHIGYNPVEPDLQMNIATTSSQNVTGFSPSAWML